jgi:hypothetical protein
MVVAISTDTSPSVTEGLDENARGGLIGAVRLDQLAELVATHG